MTLLHAARTHHRPDREALLDCSSLSSALVSLSSGLQVPQHLLQDLLLDIPPRKIHSRKSLKASPPDEALWAELQRKYPIRPWSQGTCWFHLGRTCAVGSYSRGLLPLGQVLPELWDLLESCTSPHVTLAQWQDFKANLGNHRLAWLYEQKVQDERQWGPHGMLFKEAAFQPERYGQQDFLEASETVMDICRCFQGTFGVDLLEGYRRATEPCVVQFWTPGTSKTAWVKAVYWVYGKLQGLEITPQHNLFWDARGCSVSGHQILHIEVLQPMKP